MQCQLVKQHEMCSKQKLATSSISSLLSLSLHATLKNVRLYVDSLEYLPKHIKNRMLKAFTNSEVFMKRVDIKTVLASLTHNETKFLDLTSTDLDDSILKIISKCNNLLELSVTRTTNFSLSSEGLLTVIPNFTKLCSLRMSNCYAVTDEVVKSITTNCPRLVQLDLGGSLNISDEALNYISKLEHLNSIILSNTKITSVGISALVNGPSGPNLKELQMANCSKITNDALILISCKCYNLETLVFNNCSSMNGDTSSSIENGNMKNLKQLTWTFKW